MISPTRVSPLPPRSPSTAPTMPLRVVQQQPQRRIPAGLVDAGGAPPLQRLRADGPRRRRRRPARGARPPRCRGRGVEGPREDVGAAAGASLRSMLHAEVVVDRPPARLQQEDARRGVGRRDELSHHARRRARVPGARPSRAARCRARARPRPDGRRPATSAPATCAYAVEPAARPSTTQASSSTTSRSAAHSARTSAAVVSSAPRSAAHAHAAARRRLPRRRRPVRAAQGRGVIASDSTYHNGSRRAGSDGRPRRWTDVSIRAGLRERRAHDRVPAAVGQERLLGDQRLGRRASPCSGRAGGWRRSPCSISLGDRLGRAAEPRAAGPSRRSRT